MNYEEYSVNRINYEILLFNKLQEKKKEKKHEFLIKL